MDEPREYTLIDLDIELNELKSLVKGEEVLELGFVGELNFFEWSTLEV